MKLCLLLCALLGLVGVTFAHPYEWKVCPAGASNNYGHPAKPAGRHKAPQTDKTVTLSLRLAGKAVASYCPGKTYDLQVAFPQLRQYLVTVSVGSLAGGSCGGKRASSPGVIKASSYAGKLAIPKSAAGSLVIKVTTARLSSGAYLFNTLTLARKC